MVQQSSCWMCAHVCALKGDIISECHSQMFCRADRYCFFFFIPINLQRLRPTARDHRTRTHRQIDRMFSIPLNRCSCSRVLDDFRILYCRIELRTIIAVRVCLCVCRSFVWRQWDWETVSAQDRTRSIQIQWDWRYLHSPLSTLKPLFPIWDPAQTEWQLNLKQNIQTRLHRRGCTHTHTHITGEE